MCMTLGGWARVVRPSISIFAHVRKKPRNLCSRYPRVTPGLIYALLASWNHLLGYQVSVVRGSAICRYGES